MCRRDCTADKLEAAGIDREKALKDQRVGEQPPDADQPNKPSGSKPPLSKAAQSESGFMVGKEKEASVGVSEEMNSAKPGAASCVSLEDRFAPLAFIDEEIEGESLYGAEKALSMSGKANDADVVLTGSAVKEEPGLPNEDDAAMLLVSSPLIELTSVEIHHS